MSDSSSNEVRYKCLDFLGFPNYWVGDDGSLWREIHSGLKRLNPCMSKAYPYFVQTLSEDGIRTTVAVHRLVLEAFVGPCPEGMEACHNDGDTTNNRLDNLRWDTRKGNHADRKKHGTTPTGEKNPGCKITADTVRLIRRWYTEGWTEREIREELRLSKAQVNKIINRKSWTHIE